MRCMRFFKLAFIKNTKLDISKNHYMKYSWTNEKQKECL